jgi:hypothetical protein
VNIFILDEDPKCAARMLCNRHISKMILESAQMLSSVADRYSYPSLYKPTHKNHPCTLWAGDSKCNWNWLIEHSLEMEQEKIRRTGKGHLSADIIRFYRDNGYGPNNAGLTRFALAMPDRYKLGDAVSSYRNYYLNDKQFFKDGKRPEWSPSNPPGWWSFRGIRN